MTCLAFGAWCVRVGPFVGSVVGAAAALARSPFMREVNAAQPTAELTPVAKNWRRVCRSWCSRSGFMVSSVSECECEWRVVREEGRRLGSLLHSPLATRHSHSFVQHFIQVHQRVG